MRPQRNAASRRRWHAGENTPIESLVPSLSLPAKSPARSEWARRTALMAASLVTGFRADAYTHDEIPGYVPRPGYATASGYDAPEIQGKPVLSADALAASKSNGGPLGLYGLWH